MHNPPSSAAPCRPPFCLAPSRPLLLHAPAAAPGLHSTPTPLGLLLQGRGVALEGLPVHIGLLRCPAPVSTDPPVQRRAGE